MHAMILSAAALVASAAAFTAQAQAQPLAGQHPLAQADDTRVVAYGDLDLNRPDQARVLDHRLKVAARQVCSDANLPISHYRLRALCIRAALADAWSQVAEGRPTRTAENRLVVLTALRPGAS